MYQNVGKLNNIHKGDSKTDPNNFRAISIWPIPMKIFEKLVLGQVSEFTKENKNLNDRPSSYGMILSQGSQQYWILIFPEFPLIFYCFQAIFPWLQMTKSIWFSQITWKKIFEKWTGVLCTIIFYNSLYKDFWISFV